MAWAASPIRLHSEQDKKKNLSDWIFKQRQYLQQKATSRWEEAVLSVLILSNNVKHNGRERHWRKKRRKRRLWFHKVTETDANKTHSKTSTDLHGDNWRWKGQHWCKVEMHQLTGHRRLTFEMKHWYILPTYLFKGWEVLCSFLCWCEFVVNTVE